MPQTDRNYGIQNITKPGRIIEKRYPEILKHNDYPSNQNKPALQVIKHADTRSNHSITMQSNNILLNEVNPDQLPAHSFALLCHVLAGIMGTRSKVKKMALYARYLKSLHGAESNPTDSKSTASETESIVSLQLAVQFTAEGAFPSVSGIRASAGHRTVALAASGFCGIDYDKVFKPCRVATGSASEAIEKLMDNLPEASNRRNPGWMSLEQVSEAFSRLASATGRVEKQCILGEIWEKMTAQEIRFMIRMLFQGSLRIGFELRSILPAIAQAFNADPELVRRVNMLTGNMGATAVMARNNTLDTAQFRMFQPVAFMLASPVEARNVNGENHYVSDPSGYTAEEKFDGMRAQVHISHEKILLFSRDLNDVTGSFTDVSEGLRESCSRLERSPAALLHHCDPLTPEIVFDGELCVFQNGTIQPFQRLQKRMGVKKPAKKLMQEHPVRFIAYDLLFYNGNPVIDLPLHERRKLLEYWCSRLGMLYSRQYEIATHQDIEALFQQALSHGNEGLMLKRHDGVYEFGQRNRSWLKVKQPGGSLDTIIMYAHAGSGRRGGTYSDFTLGIRVDQDPRYEEQFIPIGKAYGGYTDEELKKLNKRIRELTVDRFGPTLSLKPGVVIEVEFDGIQENRRTKAGYTLRLPRFRSIRWDLSPSDTDTLQDVEQMYRLSITRPDSPETAHQPIIFPD